VYFNSDTTGEKAYEEFFVPGEKIDMQRFQSLGVIEQTARHNMQEVDAFFKQLEAIFVKPDFTKGQVVDAIRAFIPTFEHEEKGKNLDQKM
jgi:FlaA1/EpsC-like NDP-sugar epimerase